MMPNGRRRVNRSLGCLILVAGLMLCGGWLAVVAELAQR